MTANIQLTELYENCAFLKGLQESSIESPPDGKNGQCIVHYAGNSSKHLMYVSLVNGRRDGEAILLYDGTPLFYLEYSNGSLTGSIKRMNAYGTVILKGTLLNGKETELFEEYDESGHVVWIGYYKNGSRWLQVVKDGISKYYDKKSVSSFSASPTNTPHSSHFHTLLSTLIHRRLQVLRVHCEIHHLRHRLPTHRTPIR